MGIFMLRKYAVINGKYIVKKKTPQSPNKKKHPKLLMDNI